MNTVWRELRQGARSLFKHPAFTIVAIIALALGIGANTAIFSVVNAVLIRPLPYREADRLVIVWEHNRPRDRQSNVVNPANFLDWREQNTVFEDMAAFADISAVLTGDGEPEEIHSQAATPNLFSVLGVQAIMGRTFTPDDWKPDAPRVVVIGYGLWQRRYGGDPGVVNRRIILNQREATIVGVLPADFKWFIKKGSITGNAPELWLSYPLGNNERVRRGRYLSVVARLKSDLSLDQARAGMSTIAGRLEQQYNEFNAGWGANVAPLRRELTGDIRLALLILLGAVGFLLLIACANVANLLLARAAGRQKEMAIRSALGAGRWQIVRYLLIESLLLGLLGGIAGLWLAWWGIEVMTSLSPPQLIDMSEIRINAPVLFFTLLVSLLTAVIFGLLPAVEASRLDSSEVLKEGGKNISGGLRSRRARNVFVIAEVALALVLMAGAGLLIKSLRGLQAVDPGFNAKDLLTMRVMLPNQKYPEEIRRMQFFKDSLERISSLPGVESAGAISFLPFAGPGAGTGFEIEGEPKPVPGQEPVTGVCVVDAGYFQTMQIKLSRGRLFNQQETTQMRHVVVVNQAMVRKYFPTQDPIGKRLTIRMKNENVPSEIIGVVEDSRYQSLDAEVEPMSYWPYPELPNNSMTIVIRTSVESLTMANSIREVIRQIDPEQPIADLRTMESLLASSMARARFSSMLLSILALTALVLAAVGIYGVISYNVSQRTQEIGVRVALGAQPVDILKLVVREGMLLVSIGCGLGLVSALGLTQLMKSLLFNTSVTDPLTFILIPLILGLVSLMACYLPARRATRVDPMVALRSE